MDGNHATSMVTPTDKILQSACIFRFILVVSLAAVVVISMGPTIKNRLFLHLNDYSNTILKFSESNVTNLTTKTAKFKWSTTPRLPEVKHIGFLKVHKAASSTMQNMFFRFGLRRNLTFVFTQHPNYFSRSARNHIPLAKPKYRNGYDILCNHGVFNYNIYSSLLPNDTVYLAIVREPLAVFISAVNYYTQKSQQIDYLARIPGNKIQKLIQRPEMYDRGFFSYTKNAMARDFGFPETYERSRIMAKLEELNKTFKLVLLVEHFEESLILMKRYLNWKLQDILFLSNNVYGKGESVSDLTSEDKDKFKIRNKLDYVLYNFFFKKFWDQFNSETDDIKLEVQHFKEVLHKLNIFCSKKAHVNVLTIEHSRWTEQFTVMFEDCQLMTKDELEFIRILRHKQGSELRSFNRKR